MIRAQASTTECLLLAHAEQYSPTFGGKEIQKLCFLFIVIGIDGKLCWYLLSKGGPGMFEDHGSQHRQQLRLRSGKTLNEKLKFEACPSTGSTCVAASCYPCAFAASALLACPPILVSCVARLCLTQLLAPQSSSSLLETMDAAGVQHSRTGG